MGKTLVNNLVEFYTAGEALSARDSVYVSSVDGKAYKLDVTDPNKRVFSGVAKDAVALNQFVRVVQSGKIKGFTGLSAGQVVYASTTVPGGFQLEQPTTAAETVIIGTAKNANDIIVNASLGVPFATGGGSGVGGVDILAVQDFETAVVDDFTQDGLVITDIDPLRGLKSAQLTHDSVATRFFKQVIPVDKKFRGRGLLLKLDVLSNATAGNVTITIRNETGAVDIITDRVLRINASDSLVNAYSFNIPDNCTSLSYEVKALPEAGSPITVVDDVIVQILVNDSKNDSLLLNPSFQNDIVEFDCVNATAAIVDSTLPTVNSTKMFQMTITGAGGYCDFVVPTGAKFEGLPFIIGGLFQTELLDVEYCSLVDGVEANCITIDAVADDTTDPFKKALSTETLSGATSNGLRIKTTSSTSGVINSSKIALEIGVLPRGNSINCDGGLDCENEFSARYDHLEATLSLAVKKQTPSTWIENTAKSDTSNRRKTFTVVDGVFSEKPNCVATGNGIGTNIDYLFESSTATSLVFITTNTSGGNGDYSFTFYCTKAAPDYKPITQQGAVNLGQASGALLVVTNEGTAANQTIGASTITVAFDTIKESSGISWDIVSEEATFLKAGKYEVLTHVTLSAGADVNSSIFIEMDKGSGFATLPNDDSRCWSAVRSSAFNDVNCPYVFNANAGDKIRLRVSSNGASAIVSNTTGFYPRMIIRSVLDQQTIAASLEGVPKIEGEPNKRFVEGWASFGGASDGTVCNSSPCTRYREVGNVGRSMSVIRSGTGAYEVTAAGFKASAPISCFVLTSKTGATADRIPLVDAGGFLTNGSGEAIFSVRSTNTSIAVTDSNIFIHCKGEAK